MSNYCYCRVNFLAIGAGMMDMISIDNECEEKEGREREGEGRRQLSFAALSKWNRPTIIKI